MIEICTQRELRGRQLLGFCYLCGQSLADVAKQDRNKDHVPPSGVFLAGDRNPALWLPTHCACNNRRSRQDETIKQLVMLLHGQPPNQALLPAGVLFPEGDPLDPALGSPMDFRPTIWRWVRGFHAALYGEPLPHGANHYIQPPLPSAQIVIGRLVSKDRLRQAAMLADMLKKHRALDRVDRIVCRNDTCRFENLWARADDGSWFCTFALQIYDWQNLGDNKRFPVRGCLGAYQPGRPAPEGASTASVLELPRRGGNPLDPFSG